MTHQAQFQRSRPYIYMCLWPSICNILGRKLFYKVNFIFDKQLIFHQPIWTINLSSWVFNVLLEHKSSSTSFIPEERNTDISRGVYLYIDLICGNFCEKNIPPKFCKKKKLWVVITAWYYVPFQCPAIICGTWSHF